MSILGGDGRGGRNILIPVYLFLLQFTIQLMQPTIFQNIRMPFRKIKKAPKKGLCGLGGT